jgi:hypothetical protein
MTIRIDFIRPVLAGDHAFYDRFCELRDRGYEYVEGSQRGDEHRGYILMRLPVA